MEALIIIFLAIILANLLFPRKKTTDELINDLADRS